jgi:uncharacterized surface protein with fasciclin (FAS1) repeats
MKRITGLALAGAFLTLAACTEAPTSPQYLQSSDPINEQRSERSLKPANAPTIVDVALSVNEDTGEFSTLIAAVVETGLVDALSARGQRTVFAPTDAAFAELGLNADNIGDALDADALRNILLYHVANGSRDAADVTSSDRIRMLNGGFNFITLDGTDAFIGDAQIIQPNVQASNGIIHVIDGVLLP